MVGNHSWSHSNLTTLTADQIRTELQNTSNKIASITGQAPVVFRPPGGNFNDQVQSIAASLGLSTVLMERRPKGLVATGNRCHHPERVQFDEEWLDYPAA